MVDYIDKNLDLRVISNSGQCFRINEVEPGVFNMLIKDKFIRVDHNRFDVSKKDFDKLLYNYFDLSIDYVKLNKIILKLSNNKDNYLKTCINNSKGLRILNQDKFETLISFIISQRKSIKAIKTSIERLSKICGKKIINKYGVFYAFPTPKEILSVKKDKLLSCGLGYRVPYIIDASKKVLSGEIDLLSFEKLSNENLLEKLLSIKGVGIKVASCVMLFAYHRLDVCPIDIWIKRVLDLKYKGKLPSYYSDYCGLIQQYWFNNTISNHSVSSKN